MSKQNEVLLNSFVISKKKYRVFYNGGVLVWDAENSKKGKKTISITDIISVKRSTTASGRLISKTAKPNTVYGTNSNTHSTINEGMDFDRVPVFTTSQSMNSNATINTPTGTLDTSTRVNSYDLLSNATNNDNDRINIGNIANEYYLIIHYARPVSSRTCKWRVQQMVLFNNEQRIIKLWHNRLLDDIKDQNRPKHLLIFLNPYGGKQKAFTLFEKYGKPLFKLAQIDINLIITQRAQQIYDIMTSQTINLNSYDGVVCCGGDGTFAELFNGLVYRTMIDLGLDTINPPYLPKPNLPIGIIPAGSTDTVAYCLNGTTDVKTSIIHIILGQSHGLDISSVYRKQNIVSSHSKQSRTQKHTESDNPTSGTSKSSNINKRPQLLKLYASVISYGFLGDVTMDSENYRWMGPRRYDYSGVKKFLLNRGYKGNITVELEKEVINEVSENRNNPLDGVRCLENCQRCHSSTKLSNRIKRDTEEVTISGKFLMVNGANISCACTRSPQGFNPYCHLGDGYLDLILVRHTSYLNNIRLLLAMSSKTKKISDLPFVDIYRTKKFTFSVDTTITANDGCDNSAIEDEFHETSTTTHNVTTSKNSNGGSKASRNLSKWNCDGEILPGTDIIVECNCQLINVFRRGVCCSDQNYEQNEPNIVNCCGLCK
ncbi:ceramide kinase [Malaya genurostris]|uniref:ceramide kinase n=1 Tax=Malaya genurostris TaxID=325434 RepID=UPI0026F3D175|nr:ceramide kinase [Malaya genurostris]XP_058468007.1 ceramide kinase [Malaya genurostris]XP_058468008.1 ceramide kinase [Malaya genurostris]XP_058468009.1 ceramide kinase [Malaya genurostris]XP_058468010.1 ceramide kinase [Malaya genurostris]XP_058468011.1 ceramide kinase [Malaya genurostris]XP_058468012.1 ceramide kinase [Malaya genurostris]XP_058468013.1 ceramide kinase [Malaya genurostris]